MFHVYPIRFDVIGNLEKFYKNFEINRGQN